MGACFAATACCFFWFAAFALSCFCAACLCTAFGDLSPIISLPFGCWFIDPRDVRFSESDWNREVRRGGCQIANVSSQDFQLAVRPGFEPGLKAPKTSVLPLHHRTAKPFNPQKSQQNQALQPGHPSIRIGNQMQADRHPRDSCRAVIPCACQSQGEGAPVHHARPGLHLWRKHTHPPRHGGRMMGLFYDGHVEATQPAKLRVKNFREPSSGPPVDGFPGE